MINTENVNRTNEIINFAGQIREILCINGFYTTERLTRLAEDIVVDRNDILGYEVNPTYRTIKLKLNQKVLDKYGMGKIASMYASRYGCAVVPALKRLLAESYVDMVSMFGQEKVQEIYSDDKLFLLFQVQKIDNCLIITL